MKSRTMVLVVPVLLAGFIVFCVSAESQQPASTPRQQLLDAHAKLLNERLESATNYNKATNNAYNSQTATLLDLLQSLAALTLAETALAQSSTDEIAALERSLDRLKQTEKKVEALYMTGRKGGEAHAYNAVKTARESAELSLVKAKLSQLPPDDGQQPASAEKKDLLDTYSRLLKERVESANAQHDAMQAALLTETVKLTEMLRAFDEFISAEAIAGKKSPDEVAVLERSVDQLRQVEQWIEQLRKAGLKNGEDKDYYAVKTARQSTELALVRAKLADVKPTEGQQPVLSGQAVSAEQQELIDNYANLLTDRLDSASKLASAMQASFSAETVTFGDLLRAFSQLTTAETAIAQTRAAEITAWEHSVDRLRQLEENTERLYLAGGKGGDAYHGVKTARQSAEIALLRAKLNSN